MKHWVTDPVILICSGIILVGIFGLFWAVGKFRRASSSLSAAGPSDDLGLTGPDLREIDFRAPGSVASSPPVSKDVAARLDSMTQRLTEMQSVLMKQSSGAGAPGVGGAAAGGVGQGFSPETIDKLLKIIGNVIQQVDILQKSMTVPKDI
jgi:hypothetical protein